MNEEDKELLTLNEQHEDSSTTRPSISDDKNGNSCIQPLTADSNTTDNNQNNGTNESSVCLQPSQNKKNTNTKYVSKPQNYLALAILSSFCNCPFGCLAIFFAIRSSQKYRQGNVIDSKQKGIVAKWLSIVGMALFLVVLIFLLVYKFVIIPNTISKLEDIT